MLPSVSQMNRGRVKARKLVPGEDSGRDVCKSEGRTHGRGGTGRGRRVDEGCASHGVNLPTSSRHEVACERGNCPTFSSLFIANKETRPDLVEILSQPGLSRASPRNLPGSTGPNSEKLNFLRFHRIVPTVK